MSNTKKVLPPLKVISAGDMSIDISTTPLACSFYDSVAFQANVLTGTASGTFKIYGSLDYSPGGAGSDRPLTAGTFIEVTGLSVAITSGSPANILVNLSQIAFPYIKAVYVAGSGSGTMDIYQSGRSY